MKKNKKKPILNVTLKRFAKIEKKFVPQINIRKLTKKIKSNLDLSYLKLKKKSKKAKKLKNKKTTSEIRAKQKKKEEC